MYTKGPWASNDIGSLVLANNGQTVVAACTKDREGYALGIRRSERFANARLITASPDLLKELGEADSIIRQLWSLAQKHNIPDSDPDWPMLREVKRGEAIARAT